MSGMDAYQVKPGKTRGFLPKKNYEKLARPLLVEISCAGGRAPLVATANICGKTYRAQAFFFQSVLDKIGRLLDKENVGTIDGKPDDQ